MTIVGRIIAIAVVTYANVPWDIIHSHNWQRSVLLLPLKTIPVSFDLHCRPKAQSQPTIDEHISESTSTSSEQDLDARVNESTCLVFFRPY